MKRMMMGLFLLAQAQGVQADSGVVSDGFYDVHLTMDRQEFLDCLELRGIGPDAHGSFEGTYTVPGKFTASIDDGFLVENCWGGPCREMTFSILAQEGPAPYRVYFDLRRGAVDQFRGSARLEGGRRLGLVQLTKSEIQRQGCGR